MTLAEINATYYDYAVYAWKRAIMRYCVLGCIGTSKTHEKHIASANAASASASVDRYRLFNRYRLNTADLVSVLRESYWQAVSRHPFDKGVFDKQTEYLLELKAPDIAWARVGIQWVNTGTTHNDWAYLVLRYCTDKSAKDHLSLIHVNKFNVAPDVCAPCKRGSYHTLL